MTSRADQVGRRAKTDVGREQQVESRRPPASAWGCEGQRARVGGIGVRRAGSRVQKRSPGTEQDVEPA